MNIFSCIFLVYNNCICFARSAYKYIKTKIFYFSYHNLTKNLFLFIFFINNDYNKLILHFLKEKILQYSI